MSERFFSDSWHRVEQLQVALRHHVRVRRHHYAGRAWYVLDDPVNGKSHRLSLAAYHIVGRMDGARSVDELWHEAVSSLGDDAPSQDDVIQLLANLHNNDLLRSRTGPDTLELLERYGKRSGQLAKQNLLSPTSFRIPLFDPDRFLNWTIPVVRPLITVWGFLAWLALVTYGGYLALSQWDALTDNVYDRVFSLDNMLMMLLVYPVVKALHEFGHGYVAKAYGAEVHEMGLMFLVFFPVPYVDASGANAFESKYQRAWVAAAGIAVELAIAAVAMMAWIGLEPGFWRAVAFNAMFISGVSTLLVNGNPLLKFDGYFVLTDLIEVPNLATRANKFWGYLVERYAFGAVGLSKIRAGVWEKALFLVYAPAAYIYRILLTLSIALLIATQFFIIGVLLAIWSVAVGIGKPIATSAWHVLTSPKLRRTRSRAIGLTAATIGIPLLALLLVPVPHATLAQGVLWTPEASTIRAGAAGFVADLAVASGETVTPGTLIARLDEPAFEAELRVLAADVARLRQQLQAEFTDPVLSAITQLELEDAIAALDSAQEKAERRRITAITAGRFEPAMPEANMAGRYLAEGEVLGHVLPDQAPTIRAVVDQWTIDLVRGQLAGVELLMPGNVWQGLSSSVIREVPAGGFALPSPALGLAAGGPIATDPSDQQGTTALARVFQFELTAPEGIGRDGFGGRVLVKFDHVPEPLAATLWRKARQLFLSRFAA